MIFLLMDIAEEWHTVSSTLASSSSLLSAVVFAL
ncbi:hypothetical protein BH20ACT4_BH20ACT4_11880 [soil metagenome]